MNWRGRPLTSQEVIVSTIAATTTRAGLEVHAELDDGSYPTGAAVSDADMAAPPLDRHDWHGDWNYTLVRHESSRGERTLPPGRGGRSTPKPVQGPVGRPRRKPAA
jgi:hypothetical protein